MLLNDSNHTFRIVEFKTSFTKNSHLTLNIKRFPIHLTQLQLPKKFENTPPLSLSHTSLPLPSCLILTRVYLSLPFILTPKSPNYLNMHPPLPNNPSQPLQTRPSLLLHLHRIPALTLLLLLRLLLMPRRDPPLTTQRRTILLLAMLQARQFFFFREPDYVWFFFFVLLVVCGG